jgi:1-acyl-sn-glycerol-3-phosphate acyltransferase
MEPTEELEKNARPALGLPLEDRKTVLMAPSFRLRLRTQIQMWVGHALLLPFCGVVALILRYAGKYEVEDRKALRDQFKEIAKNNSPLIICSNHLTFIDSLLIIWALASNPWYFFHYKSFSWNLPAGDVFKKKFIYRVVAYLGKCIFIHRDGTKEHKEEILSLTTLLLRKGHVVTIFPEGRRSRLGKFDIDHVTFGVGKIIASLGECNVLCWYMRSHKQETFSNYPAKGSKFRILTKLIKIKPEKTGRHGYLEAASQIGKEIKQLEDQYFSNRGQNWN